MKVIAFLISLIGVICLLCYSVSAIDVPTVKMPNGDASTTINDGATETSVGWWAPKPPCYECMPEPTPAPVYETIGLTTAVSSTKVRMNSNVNFAGTQISGTPVLSTTPWQWIIQTPRGFSNGVINGQIATFKVEPGNFGKWQVNLNVRDSIQMLNGHLSTSVDIIKK